MNTVQVSELILIISMVLNFALGIIAAAAISRLITIRSKVAIMTQGIYWQQQNHSRAIKTNKLLAQDNSKMLGELIALTNKLRESELERLKDKSAAPAQIYEYPIIFTPTQADAYNGLSNVGSLPDRSELYKLLPSTDKWSDFNWIAIERGVANFVAFAYKNKPFLDEEIERWDSLGALISFVELPESIHWSETLVSLQEMRDWELEQELSNCKIAPDMCELFGDSKEIIGNQPIEIDMDFILNDLLSTEEIGESMFIAVDKDGEIHGYNDKPIDRSNYWWVKDPADVRFIRKIDTNIYRFYWRDMLAALPTAVHFKK
jgi:hypothetical protein